MTPNLIRTTHQNGTQEKPVIGAKLASKYIKVTYSVFKAEIDEDATGGAIKWQARIDDEDSSRPIFGFSKRYLDEVAAALPKERGKGKKVFTPDVKARLAIINKRWERENYIWKDEEKLAEKVRKKMMISDDFSRPTKRKKLNPSSKDKFGE